MFVHTLPLSRLAWMKAIMNSRRTGAQRAHSQHWLCRRKNLIFVHFMSDRFNAYFVASLLGGLWHPFGRISDCFRILFGIMLFICFADAVKRRVCHIFWEMLVFGGAGPLFLHYLCKPPEVVFYAAVWTICFSILIDFAFQRGSLLGSIL